MASTSNLWSIMTSVPSSTAFDVTHSYTLTRWDLLCMHFHGLLRNRILIGFLVILSTWVACRDLRSAESTMQPMVVKVIYVIAFNAVCLGMAAAAGLVMLTLMVIVRKHDGLLGEHTLEVTRRGLVERTAFNETLHQWRGLRRVARRGRYLYIWVTDSMLHVVPLRSFASDDAAQAFQRLIETYVMAATNSREATAA